jgi:hypothetical protein
MTGDPASGAAQRPDCDHAKAQQPPEWRHLVIGVKVGRCPMEPVLRWSAGLVTDIAVALFLIARRSSPAWVENWQDGAFGEQRTGRALRELESQGCVSSMT